MKLLSILIPTVEERKEQFEKLKSEFERQAKEGRFKTKIEIFSRCDNKEMTIGEKRNKLYEMAKGLYSVQWDDDDWIHPEGLKMILNAIPTQISKSAPDCITYKEDVTIDGNKFTSNFSLLYEKWHDKPEGYDYARTPFFKTPILTHICQQVQIPHIRWNEDEQWANAIKPLLKSETHIDEFIYQYRHESSDFKQRYGIK